MAVGGYKLACFRPIDAWQLDGGEIVFKERGKIRRALRLPCGRCIGCRQVRVRSWALRCLHEAQMHEASCFITLTYDDAHYYPSLNYVDFQRFMYRLRKRCGPTRFFMCGEYGSENWRPHFHAILFGLNFSDRSPFGKDYDRSVTLESLWNMGHSSVGDLSYQSAAYVARYSLKKRTGVGAIDYYRRYDAGSGEVFELVPEFGHMSLKPGIGYSWFQKYWKEVFSVRDGVCMPGGRVIPAPRYYMDLLDNIDSDLSDYKELERYVRSGKFADECTPERLAVRETCALAREQLRRRGL